MRKSQKRLSKNKCTLKAQEWGQDSVNNWAVPPDGWSIRFNGQLEAPYSEEFTLTTRANGGTRLWIRDPDAGV